MLAEIKAATRRKTSDKKEMLPPIPKSDELSSHMSQMNLAPKTPPTMYHEPPQHPITLPQRVEPSIDPVQQQLINQQMLHQQHLQQLQEATKITAQVQVKSMLCVYAC